MMDLRERVVYPAFNVPVIGGLPKFSKGDRTVFRGKCCRIVRVVYDFSDATVLLELSVDGAYFPADGGMFPFRKPWWKRRFPVWVEVVLAALTFLLGLYIIFFL